MNVRTELRKYQEQRFKIKGVVSRFGKKSAFKGRELDTILFINIVKASDDSFLTDHIWFTKGKWAENLQVNDVVEFDVRVKTYEKGYKGYREFIEFEKPIVKDWKFSHPSNVQIISRKDEE